MEYNSTFSGRKSSASTRRLLILHDLEVVGRWTKNDHEVLADAGETSHHLVIRESLTQVEYKQGGTFDIRLIQLEKMIHHSEYSRVSFEAVVTIAVLL